MQCGKNCGAPDVPFAIASSNCMSGKAFTATSSQPGKTLSLKLGDNGKFRKLGDPLRSRRSPFPWGAETHTGQTMTGCITRLAVAVPFRFPAPVDPGHPQPADLLIRDRELSRAGGQLTLNHSSGVKTVRMRSRVAGKTGEGVPEIQRGDFHSEGDRMATMPPEGATFNASASDGLTTFSAYARWSG